MSTFDSFRAARWLRTFNLVVQAVLFVTLFLGLNYLAQNHPGRFDLTQQRRYSLSPETLSWLSTLKQPVRIIVTLPEDSDDPVISSTLADIHGLLREYAFATEGNYDSRSGHDGRVLVDYVDVYQRRADADQLGVKDPNVIVLISGDKRRVVEIGELYGVTDRERKDFRGERAITAAVLEVSSPKRKKIYFLAGHGEMQIDDVSPNRGLSALKDLLRERNFEVESLDVTTSRRVPDDAALIIAIDPQGIDEYVEEQLRQYLTNRAGHMILMLAPQHEYGLHKLLLDDWGVLADDDLIYDPDPNYRGENDDNIIKWFTPHPITKTLQDYNLSLRFGPTRSLRNFSASLGGGLTVETLAATSPTAWGERFPRSAGKRVFRSTVDIKGDPHIDPKNSLGVIIASERVGTRGNLDFSIPRGRLVVFGSADVVTNRRIGILGNQNVFLAAVNWAVDRDTQLNIPPRPIEQFQISLSAQQMVQLRYCLLLVLPGIAALMCLTVYWTRRT
jgi:ABC-type uncharacterized transport system involved in gliding motility auxiliary subunit